MSVLPKEVKPVAKAEATRWRIGIRGKLTLLLLLVLVPLVAFDLAIMQEHFRERVEQELSASRELAETIGVAVEQYIQGIWSMQRALGEAILLTEWPTAVEEATGLLRRQLNLHPALYGLAWLSPKGDVIATTFNDDTESVVDHPDLRRLLEGERRVLSDVFYLRDHPEIRSDEPVLGVGVAIYKGDELRGIIAGGLNPRILGELLAVKQTHDRVVNIIDRSGSIVYESDGGTGGGIGVLSSDAADLLEQVRAGEPVSSERMRLRSTDEEQLGSVVPIEGLDWAVAAMSSSRHFMRSVQRDLYRNLLILGIVAVASFAVAAMIGNSLVSRFESLRRASVAWAAGEFHVQADASGNDELAETVQSCNRMAATLRRLDEERQRFLDVMAHEVRNPLTTSKGLTQLLLYHAKSNQPIPDLQDKLERLNRALDRVTGIVHETTVSFRKRDLVLEVHREVMDIEPMIRDVVASLRKDAAHRRIELNVHGEYPTFVYGDMMRLRQVVINLVENAIKYSPDHTVVRVEIATDPRWVRVRVIDEGIGIPAGEEEQIFEEFYRASNISTQPGTGLGLYVCREIIHKHDGKIWAERGEVGTIFIFELPRFEGDATPGR